MHSNHTCTHTLSGIMQRYNMHTHVRGHTHTQCSLCPAETHTHTHTRARSAGFSLLTHTHTHTPAQCMAMHSNHTHTHTHTLLGCAEVSHTHTMHTHTCTQTHAFSRCPTPPEPPDLLRRDLWCLLSLVISLAPGAAMFGPQLRVLSNIIIIHSRVRDNSGWLASSRKTKLFNFIFVGLISPQQDFSVLFCTHT